MFNKWNGKLNIFVEFGVFFLNFKIGEEDGKEKKLLHNDSVCRKGQETCGVDAAAPVLKKNLKCDF